MIEQSVTENTLFYGDNLQILRDYIPDECIDLIYLDPPFNSKRTYNVLFRYESGEESEAQIAAFDDTWHWNRATEATYQELLTDSSERVSRMIAALREFIGPSQMLAYLVMMAARLVELYRVLKPTGSLYLHCDPTASHYLKIILDTIFDPRNFRNEIVWKRADAHNDSTRYGKIHDTIFFYTKSSEYTWNEQYTPYKEEYLKAEWRKLPSGRMYKTENMLDPRNTMSEYDFMGTVARWRTNHKGMMKLWNAPQTEVPNSHGRVKLGRNGNPIKRCRIVFLDEMPGVRLQSWWDDITSLRGNSKERLGYPTQKPISLIERIILSSSDEKNVILDPFCGCGTTVAAAQQLDRKWIGIDITHLSIALMKYRLQEMFPDITFKTVGEPESTAAARYLAEHDRFQFEWWALSLVKARPSGGKKGSKRGKKGADRGIDGIITFIDDSTGKPKRIIVQVKSGKVGSRDIRDLVGTVKREKQAVIGIFITLESPTRPMITEAASAGFYHSPGWGQDYPAIQILTVDQLLNGTTVNMPPQTQTSITFKQAERVKKSRDPQQKSLFD